MDGQPTTRPLPVAMAAEAAVATTDSQALSVAPATGPDTEDSTFSTESASSVAVHPAVTQPQQHPTNDDTSIRDDSNVAVYQQQIAALQEQLRAKDDMLFETELSLQAVEAESQQITRQQEQHFLLKIRQTDEEKRRATLEANQAHAREAAWKQKVQELLQQVQQQQESFGSARPARVSTGKENALISPTLSTTGTLEDYNRSLRLGQQQAETQSRIKGFSSTNSSMGNTPASGSSSGRRLALQLLHWQSPETSQCSPLAVCSKRIACPQSLQYNDDVKNSGHPTNTMDFMEGGSPLRQIREEESTQSDSVVHFLTQRLSLPDEDWTDVGLVWSLVDQTVPHIQAALSPQIEMTEIESSKGSGVPTRRDALVESERLLIWLHRALCYSPRGRTSLMEACASEENSKSVESAPERGRQHRSCLRFPSKAGNSSRLAERLDWAKEELRSPLFDPVATKLDSPLDLPSDRMRLKVAIQFMRDLCNVVLLHFPSSQPGKVGNDEKEQQLRLSMQAMSVVSLLMNSHGSGNTKDCLSYPWFSLLSSLDSPANTTELKHLSLWSLWDLAATALIQIHAKSRRESRRLFGTELPLDNGSFSNIFLSRTSNDGQSCLFHKTKSWWDASDKVHVQWMASSLRLLKVLAFVADRRPSELPQEQMWKDKEMNPKRIRRLLASVLDTLELAILPDESLYPTALCLECVGILEDLISGSFPGLSSLVATTTTGESEGPIALLRVEISTTACESASWDRAVSAIAVMANLFHALAVQQRNRDHLVETYARNRALDPIRDACIRFFHKLIRVAQLESRQSLKEMPRVSFMSLLSESVELYSSAASLLLHAPHSSTCILGADVRDMLRQQMDELINDEKATIGA